VTLSYLGAKDGRPGADSLAVAAPAGRPSAPLRLAHLLIDEYLVLKGASTAFHQEGNPKKAYALLNGLAGRISKSDVKGLEGERKLVGDMLQQAAFYSGYGGEQPPKSLRHLAVVGTWVVRSASGFSDLAPGDRLSFNRERELTTVRPKPRKGLHEEETENYEINERQIHLTDSALVLNYWAGRDRLTLEDKTSQARLVLARIEEDATP
jgi:Ca-activated chloride channel family protein